MGNQWKSMENWNNLTLSKTRGKLKETGKTIWKKSGQCGSLGGQKKMQTGGSSQWRLGPGPRVPHVHHGSPWYPLPGPQPETEALPAASPRHCRDIIATPGWNWALNNLIVYVFLITSSIIV
jgi:hypothetical protein